MDAAELASFNPELCALYVEMLLIHDEVERALAVIENVPAFYRDNLPPALRTLRSEILAARYTATTYVNSPNDAGVNAGMAVQEMRYMLRGRILEAEVMRYNEAKVIPHIIEMGPGTYFLPQALGQLGYEFTYWDLALNAQARELTKYLPRQVTPAETSPTVFLAMEVIEHLADPKEIAIEAAKLCPRGPDRVHLSTPLYTYDTKHADWRTRDGLPHLRAYTPMEFLAEAGRLFPGYHWTLMHDRIMSLRGQRADTYDKEPLEIGESTHGS